MKPVDQEALLLHAVKVHGLAAVACPDCGGCGCRRCEGHGFLFKPPRREPCGDPDCQVLARFAEMEREKRS